MNTRDLAAVLPVIFRELVDGSPDPAARTYLLNRGDAGLLASLDRLSATAASAPPPGGGAPIAAHVDHLRYGLALLNRLAAGAPVLAHEVDFTASWSNTAETDAEWRSLREGFRREAAAWADVLGATREVSELEARWIAASVAHVAYHLGAIRQIDRAARGPTAEDEARAEAALRAQA